MIKISFLGDIICQMPFLKAAQKRGNDFYTAFSGLKSLLDESDYVVANLETPIAGEDSGYSNELYSFNTPAVFLDALKELKIDLFLTANNHCLDRGVAGLKSTISELDKKEMAHTGTAIEESSHEFYLNQISDTTCAFLSYTACVNGDKWDKYKSDLSDYNLNLIIDIDKYLTYRNSRRAKTIPLYHLRKRIGDLIPHSLELKIKNLLGIKICPMVDNEPLDEVAGEVFNKLENTILKAKEKADLVFFLPHCGGQFNKTPGNLSKSIFEKLLESKADAVIGNHPHTVQKAGFLNGKPYAFSLGNVSSSPSYPFKVEESLPDYGMVFHTYIEDKKIIKSTFSFIKSIEEKDHYPLVKTIDDLYSTLSEKERIKLKNDVSNICGRIFGDNGNSYGIQREYEIEK